VDRRPAKRRPRLQHGHRRLTEADAIARCDRAAGEVAPVDLNAFGAAVEIQHVDARALEDPEVAPGDSARAHDDVVARRRADGKGRVHDAVNFRATCTLSDFEAQHSADHTKMNFVWREYIHSIEPDTTGKKRPKNHIFGPLS
jgi:hypothetical protein